VPGGLTAALHRRYRGSAAATSFPYYAYISSHGGYVAVQYWFFYAMNDWRSSFGGVNDHEADWEQVTVYLVPLGEDAAPASRPDGSDVLRVGWVAFSSHDETGDDLRRRCDDPDITWVDQTHRWCMPAQDRIPAPTCRGNTWCGWNRLRCNVFWPP